MVARGPGAVGCAHCTRLGAEVGCPACGHLVCPACAADWTSCELAKLKMFELEAWTTITDVDWGGRYLLARRGLKFLAVFDLRAGRWIGGEVPHERDTAAWITRGGEVITAQYRSRTDGPGRSYLGLARFGADGELFGETMRAPLPNAPCVLTSRDDVIAYKTQIVRVALVSLADGKLRILEPLKGKVIEGVAVSGDLLAAAAWGELALYRMTGSALELRTHHGLDGDVKWCALAGSTLAAADAERVYAWRVRADGNAHEQVLSVEREARAFALSSDGAFLAAGDVVYDLARGTRRTLGATDAVVFVKFVADDRWLVTYDAERQLVMRAEYGR